MVERLLDEGASIRARDASGRTALVAAAYGSHLEVAEVLVEAGADVNAKDDTEQSAYLISTSEVGDDTRLLGLTLENGADVRSLDSYDGTGLIRAADRGHVGIVEELLKTDTNIDHVNNLGWTAPGGDHPRRGRRAPRAGRAAACGRRRGPEPPRW